MAVITPGLQKDIQKYSTKSLNVSECFNCGNCTAICPLSTEEQQFPRYIIRRAMIGQKEKIITAENMWLCAYCNECSETCPRDANPGEFVQATRKWALSQFDPSGISRLLLTSSLGLFLGLLFAALLVVAFVSAFGDFSVVTNDRPIQILQFIEKLPIEIIGIIFGVLFFVGIGLQVFNQFRMFGKNHNSSFWAGLKQAWKTRGKDHSDNTYYHLLFSPFIMLKVFFRTLIFDSMLQTIHRECETEQTKPLVRSRWFMHMLVLWGFGLLLVATAFNMVWPYLDSSRDSIENTVSVFFFSRFVGILGGLLLMAGVSIQLVARLRKRDKYTEKSTLEDWLFLVLLWLVGFTGFVITVSFYVSEIPALIAYYGFILHLIVVIQFFLLGLFGKLAHAWLRPTALWFIRGLEERAKKLNG